VWQSFIGLDFINKLYFSKLPRSGKVNLAVGFNPRKWREVIDASCKRRLNGALDGFQSSLRDETELMRFVRGLKPTATLISSLRDVTSTKQMSDVKGANEFSFCLDP
jgi:hypothetical protein